MKKQASKGNIQMATELEKILPISLILREHQTQTTKAISLHTCQNGLCQKDWQQVGKDVVRI